MKWFDAMMYFFSQQDIDAAITQLTKQIAALEIEREDAIAHTEFVHYGRNKNTHGSIRQSYSQRIAKLRREISKLKTTKPISVSQAIKERILELEQAKINTTSYERAEISKRITCLIKHGVENVSQVPEIMQSIVDIKQQRYGNGCGDISKLRQSLQYARQITHKDWSAKATATKLARYGNAGGNVEAICKTKELRYGYRNGNVPAIMAAKRAKYGNLWGDMEQIKATKRERYGNASGDIGKMMATQCAKYGGLFGGPSKRPGAIVSKTNLWWRDYLQQHLPLKFDTDAVCIYSKSYDLNCITKPYMHLLIEICPTFTHNSTTSFEFATGRAATNHPLPFDYHFNKTQLALKHGYTCITVFDWMTLEQVVDIIKQHLDKTIDSTDFCFNPQQSIDKSTIRKHWTKLNSKEHITDIGQDDEQMIADGYVAVYDCGYAKLLADDCGHC